MDTNLGELNPSTFASFYLATGADCKNLNLQDMLLTCYHNIVKKKRISNQSYIEANIKELNAISEIVECLLDDPSLTDAEFSQMFHTLLQFSKVFSSDMTVDNMADVMTHTYNHVISSNLKVSSSDYSSFLNFLVKVFHKKRSTFSFDDKNDAPCAIGAENHISEFISNLNQRVNAFINVSKFPFLSLANLAIQESTIPPSTVEITKPSRETCSETDYHPSKRRRTTEECISSIHPHTITSGKCVSAQPRPIQAPNELATTFSNQIQKLEERYQAMQRHGNASIDNYTSIQSQRQRINPSSMSMNSVDALQSDISKQGQAREFQLKVCKKTLDFMTEQLFGSKLIEINASKGIVRNSTQTPKDPASDSECTVFHSNPFMLDPIPMPTSSDPASTSASTSAPIPGISDSESESASVPVVTSESVPGSGNGNSQPKQEQEIPSDTKTNMEPPTLDDIIGPNPNFSWISLLYSQILGVFPHGGIDLNLFSSLLKPQLAETFAKINILSSQLQSTFSTLISLFEAELRQTEYDRAKASFEYEHFETERLLQLDLSSMTQKTDTLSSEVGDIKSHHAITLNKALVARKLEIATLESFDTTSIPATHYSNYDNILLDIHPIQSSGETDVDTLTNSDTITDITTTLSSIQKTCLDTYITNDQKTKELHGLINTALLHREYATNMQNMELPSVLAPFITLVDSRKNELDSNNASFSTISSKSESVDSPRSVLPSDTEDSDQNVCSQNSLPTLVPGMMSDTLPVGAELEEKKATSPSFKALPKHLLQSRSQILKKYSSYVKGRGFQIPSLFVHNFHPVPKRGEATATPLFTVTGSNHVIPYEFSKQLSSMVLHCDLLNDDLLHFIERRCGTHQFSNLILDLYSRAISGENQKRLVYQTKLLELENSSSLRSIQRSRRKPASVIYLASKTKQLQLPCLKNLQQRFSNMESQSGSTIVSNNQIQCKTLTNQKQLSNDTMVEAEFYPENSTSSGSGSVPACDIEEYLASLPTIKCVLPDLDAIAKETPIVPDARGGRLQLSTKRMATNAKVSLRQSIYTHVDKLYKFCYTSWRLLPSYSYQRAEILRSKAPINVRDSLLDPLYHMKIVTHLDCAHTWKDIVCQENLTEENRAVTLNWLRDVFLENYGQIETYFLACRIFDKALSGTQMHRKDLQLYAAAALSIACKIHDKAVRFDFIRLICGDLYPRNLLVATELALCHRLWFQFNTPTLYSLLAEMALVLDLSPLAVSFMQFFAYICILDFQFVSQTLSAQALAIMFAVLSCPIHSAYQSETAIDRISRIIDDDSFASFVFCFARLRFVYVECQIYTRQQNDTHYIAIQLYQGFLHAPIAYQLFTNFEEMLWKFHKGNMEIRTPFGQFTGIFNPFPNIWLRGFGRDGVAELQHANHDKLFEFSDKLDGVIFADFMTVSHLFQLQISDEKINNSFGLTKICAEFEVEAFRMYQRSTREFYYEPFIHRIELHLMQHFHSRLEMMSTQNSDGNFAFSRNFIVPTNRNIEPEPRGQDVEQMDIEHLERIPDVSLTDGTTGEELESYPPVTTETHRNNSDIISAENDHEPDVFTEPME